MIGLGQTFSSISSFNISPVNPTNTVTPSETAEFKLTNTPTKKQVITCS